MNCLAHIIKYILFAANLVFLVCGILLIALGGVSITSLKDFESFAEADSTSTLPICVIILGCIIFIVSFLGCCGAIKDSRCLVNSYCICLLVLIILQLALTGYAWFNKDKIMDKIGEVVDKAWANDNPTYMDTFQISYNCCGKKNYMDYTSMGKKIPNSCCGSLTNACDESKASTLPGCRSRVLEFWGSNTNIVKFFGLGVAAVELCILVLAWFLSSSIKVSLRDRTV